MKFVELLDHRKRDLVKYGHRIQISDKGKSNLLAIKYEQCSRNTIIYRQDNVASSNHRIFERILKLLENTFHRVAFRSIRFISNQTTYYIVRYVQPCFYLFLRLPTLYLSDNAFVQMSLRIFRLSHRLCIKFVGRATL